MKKLIILMSILFIVSISAFVYTYNFYNVKNMNDYEKNDYYILKGTFNILKQTMDESALNWGKGERFAKNFQYIEYTLNEFKADLSSREYDLYYNKTAKCVNVMDDILDLKTLIGNDYDIFKEKYDNLIDDANNYFEEFEGVI